MPLDEIGVLLELHEHEGQVARPAHALATFRRRMRLLEASRAAIEQGVARLQAAIEQLSQSGEQHCSTQSEAGRTDRGGPLREAAA
jgi:DNA-binding transcriptional MerR regulator